MRCAHFPCDCFYLSPSDVCDAEYRDEFMSDLDALRPSPERESVASAVRAPAAVIQGWGTYALDLVYFSLVPACLGFVAGYVWGLL